MLTPAVRGRVPAPGTTGWRALFDRSTSADAVIRERTAAILARVRREGDTAFRAMALEFDGVDLGPLDRVGVYAPGGLATYPSSLLMGIVPVCGRAGGAVAARVRNTGTIFIGATSSVASGRPFARRRRGDVR